MDQVPFKTSCPGVCPSFWIKVLPVFPQPASPNCMQPDWRSIAPQAPHHKSYLSGERGTAGLSDTPISLIFFTDHTTQTDQSADRALPLSLSLVLFLRPTDGMCYCGG